MSDFSPNGSALLELPTALGARRVKRRYNVTLDPADVARMDALAARLGVSRSELLAFAFNRLETDYRISGGE